MNGMTVMQLAVGDDAFRAQMLSDVLRDEGVRNELVLSDDPYGPIGGYTSHWVFIDQVNREHAERVIADHPAHPPVDVGVHGDVEPKRTSVSFPARLAIIGVLAAVFIPGVVYFALNVIEAFI